MLSFWERDSWFPHFDFLIIGAGIVGLSAAYRLRQLHPKARIAILERGVLPNGASTKNAGFACFGSLSEIASDLKTASISDVHQLILKRYQGLQLLRSLVGDDKLDYRSHGGYEVFQENDEQLYVEATQLLNQMNSLLREEFGEEPVYSYANEKISRFQFHGFKYMLFNRAEAQIDTGKMMRALLDLVRQQGIDVFMGIEVTQIEEADSGIRLHTKLGELTANHALLSTNAFAAQLVPELNIVKPGRAQVLITSPIENLPFQGTFHLDEGYYYFRNVGQRVLIGGGRNLDRVGETTFSHDITDTIQNALEELLKTHILPNKQFTIEHRWAGTLGLGEQKSPIIKMLSKRLACSVRMGGMGVALGCRAGFDGAELFS